MRWTQTPVQSLSALSHELVAPVNEENQHSFPFPTHSPISLPLPHLLHSRTENDGKVCEVVTQAQHRPVLILHSPTPTVIPNIITNSFPAMKEETLVSTQHNFISFLTHVYIENVNLKDTNASITNTHCEDYYSLTVDPQTHISYSSASWEVGRRRISLHPQRDCWLDSPYS